MIDRLTDWLLSRCPLTTLTLLTLLVGSSLSIPRPWQIVGFVLTGDLAINAMKWLRTKRSRHLAELRRGVPA